MAVATWWTYQEPCLEALIKAAPLRCPLCRRTFTATEAQPFRLLNDILEIVQTKQSVSTTCSKCDCQTNSGKSMCDGCMQAADLNLQLHKLKDKPKTAASARIPQDVDCGNICYSITCPGSSVCRLTHIDDLSFAGMTSVHLPGPAENNSSYGQSCSKKSTKLPEQQQDDVESSSDLCTNLSCPGMPTCSKMHLVDVLNPPLGDRSRHGRLAPTCKSGLGRPLPVYKPQSTSGKAKTQKSPEIDQFCTDITCRGSSVCRKVHMADLMASMS
uniref:Uncharacterized protein n=1 Tax=Schistocephalus solidus TaxID=70667 RepID=A0A0V0J3W8_SCHSO